MTSKELESNSESLVVVERDDTRTRPLTRDIEKLRRVRKIRALLGSVCCLAVGVLFIQSVVQKQKRPQSIPMPVIQSGITEAPLMERARASTPGIVSQVYEALDAGDAGVLRKFIGEDLRNDYSRLDAICKPFTYSAHYIEALIERPQNFCHARVRALFKPITEEAQIFVFQVQSNKFLLVDVLTRSLSSRRSTEEYADWFKVEEETAVELARNFIYGLTAGRHEILEKSVIAGLPTLPYLQPNWREAFSDFSIQQVRSVALRNHKGLKIDVVLDMTGKFFGWHFASARFFVESVEGEQKIVWAAPLASMPGFGFAEPRPPGTPIMLDIKFQYPEDATMEARTLARFGLK